MIPEGTYRARVVQTGIGLSPNGHEQVEVVLQILKGPLEGRRMQWFGYLNTNDNAERAGRVMQTCGWNGKDLQTMTRNEVDIVVRHETYKGRTGARVVFVNEPRELTLKRCMPEGAKSDVVDKLSALARHLRIGEPRTEGIDDIGPSDGDPDEQAPIEGCSHADPL